MGVHRGHSRAGRPLVGRVTTAVAAGAVLAAVAGSLLAGAGAADEGPALAGALPAASVVEPAVAAPVLAPAPAVESARRAAAAPEVPAAEPKADEPPEKVPAKDPAPATKVRTSGGPAAPVSGTPCTATARACVDLTEYTAWLIENGEIKRGPVGVMIGDEEEDPTPVGTFTVEWKAKEYTSRELLVEMPYAIFFAPGGVAFHEGRQDTSSAGCVKLTNPDAIAWFDFLQVGDEVQVVGSAEG